MVSDSSRREWTAYPSQRSHGKQRAQKKLITGISRGQRGFWLGGCPFLPQQVGLLQNPREEREEVGIEGPTRFLFHDAERLRGGIGGAVAAGGRERVPDVRDRENPRRERD